MIADMLSKPQLRPEVCCAQFQVKYNKKVCCDAHAQVHACSCSRRGNFFAVDRDVRPFRLDCRSSA